MWNVELWRYEPLSTCMPGGAPPGVLAILVVPAASGAGGAAMSRGQGAGRKKLAVCQGAAEDGSRGQLVSEERLDRGHGSGSALWTRAQGPHAGGPNRVVRATHQSPA